VTYDFAAELKANAERFEAILDLELSQQVLGRRVPERLIAAMRHGSLNGGKRLRPLLLTQAAAIFGVDRQKTSDAALAIEMVHCYSLIHDDLPAMDDDDLRRGQPTVHKAFDEATAILAGDALLTRAFWLLVNDEAGYGPETAVALVAELSFSAGPAGMVGGQMADIEGETRFMTERAIAEMQAMKTGELIMAAVRMGAIIGGASEEELKHLTDYARAAGRAFQLADDILDVTASAEVMGKATGKDASAGKQTIVARIGLDAAQRQLGEVIHDALSALIPFGDRAEGLRATAKFFAQREN
jgi:farnesyl diphosphate synthase